jgi:adenylate cyclase
MDLSVMEHHPSAIYEIRRIQESFLKMKLGMSSFARYVPFEVVREMMVKGEEATLGVKPREVTIFFSDIEGFTTVCEKMAPNDLLALLSEYFAAMAKLILQTHGTLLEFIGDAILACWNAPMEVEDHAYQCVHVALSMNEELRLLASTWKLRGYPPVNIRCGIHTATVFVGNIGSPDRMKYGVLGDGVNLASRLEELNKRYTTKVLISETTFAKQKVRDNFLIRPVDFVVVKGRSGGTRILEVVARRELATDTLRQVTDLHSEAVDSYFARDFDRTIDLLERVKCLRPNYNDKAAQVLLDRAQKFKANPPPEEWDGCDVLTEKHF